MTASEEFEQMMRETGYEADVISCIQADEFRMPGAYAFVGAGFLGFSYSRGFERKGFAGTLSAFFGRDNKRAKADEYQWNNMRYRDVSHLCLILGF